MIVITFINQEIIFGAYLHAQVQNSRVSVPYDSLVKSFRVERVWWFQSNIFREKVVIHLVTGAENDRIDFSCFSIRKVHCFSIHRS